MKHNIFLLLLIFITATSMASINNEKQQSTDENQTALINESDKEIITEFSLKKNMLFEETKEVKVSKDKTADSTFVHVVLFWLKNPNNQEERDQFEASIGKFIKNSKHVKSMHLGSPASTSRPVIDSSYTYCLIVSFPTKDEHDKYQAEEKHKIFIKESENLWEKVLIYDSVNLW